MIKMGDHSRRLFSTWVALFLSMGSVACAYATVIIATTLAQPSFMYVGQSVPHVKNAVLSYLASDYMHLNTASNASQLIGAVNGVYISGALIGALLCSQSSDRLGRRRSVFVASTFMVLGGALQAGSVHIAMFIVARLITGFGVGERLLDPDIRETRLILSMQEHCKPQFHFIRVKSPRHRRVV